MLALLQQWWVHVDRFSQVFLPSKKIPYSFKAIELLGSAVLCFVFSSKLLITYLWEDQRVKYLLLCGRQNFLQPYVLTLLCQTKTLTFEVSQITASY